MQKRKLNLGCGRRILPDYINIDSTPFKNQISLVRVMDVRDLLYEDESVDEILAEFVLEHLWFYEHQETLWEWWRVLKFGGKLTIVVPDFEVISRKYLNNIIDMETLHFELFTSIINNNKKMPHHSTFDKPYLRKILEKEGFEVEEMENIKMEIKAVCKKIERENLWR
jgi:predicted SAM-dependent methyltransferase